MSLSADDKQALINLLGNADPNIKVSLVVKKQAGLYLSVAVGILNNGSGGGFETIVQKQADGSYRKIQDYQQISPEKARELEALGAPSSILPDFDAW